MRLFERSIITIGVVGLLAAPVRAEDLTIVYQVTGPGAGTATQYISEDRVRVVEGDSDMLFEHASGAIINIDHSRKEFSETSLAELEAVMASATAEAGSAAAKMKESMDQMPPALRERMAGMLGGDGEAVLTKGGTREIAGYTTVEYTISQGESLTMQIWSTTQLVPPISAADMRRMFTARGPLAGMAKNPMLKGFAQAMEKMIEIEGFPLATATSMKIMGRGMQSSREASSVELGSIPASTFDLAQIAKGYEKVEAPLAKAGR